MKTKATLRCIVTMVGLLSLPSYGVQQVPPLPNSMKVVALWTVNEGLTSLSGAQMFEFATDTAISFGAGWTCLTTNPINWFGVPKANPSPGGTGDNPAYRDSVNALMLAFSLNKPIRLQVDGCIGGVPRVVNVEVDY